MRFEQLMGALLPAALTFSALGGPTESATIEPPGTRAHDRVGHAIDMDDDVLVVGARASGRASVYRLVGSRWVRETDLRPPGAEPGDLFGSSVGVDGNVCVIGAPWRSTAAGATGEAWIYRRSGGGWSRRASLVGSGTQPGDQFGASVAVSGDVAVVGAPTAMSPTGNMGVVYIFERSGADWNEVKMITPPPGELPDAFGRSVAIDGGTILVGSALDGATPTGAYIYRRSGADWAHEATLQAPTRGPGDSFGIGVDLKDGLAVVGAKGTAPESGWAYVFSDDAGAWNLAGVLTPRFPMPGDGFGQSVATDGNRVVVGAPMDDTDATHTGTAYVFERDPALPGVWRVISRLRASSPAPSDRFGRSVAIATGGGGVVGVGAPLRDDDDGTPNTGLVYVYRRLGACDLDWNQDGCFNDQDFFDFANDYFNAIGPRGHADFNDDGIENDADFVEYLAAMLDPDC